MKLILVKHSLPEIDPGLSANRWKLSSEGRRLCLSQADQPSNHTVDSVISGTEPKAVETGKILARALGRPFHHIEGLHEHDGSDVGYFHDGEDFDKAVYSPFENPSEPALSAVRSDT